MKKILLLIVVTIMLLPTTNLWGQQNLKTIISDEMKLRNKELPGFIHANKHGLFTFDNNLAPSPESPLTDRVRHRFSFKTNEFNVRKYNTSFQETKLLEIEKEKRVFHIGPYLLNDEFIYIKEFYNKDSDQQEFSLDHYDYADLGKKKSTPIVNIDIERKKELLSSEDLIISKSKKIIAFTYSSGEYEKKGEPEKSYIKVLNTDGKVIWSKKIDLKYTAKEFDVISKLVDEAGNFYTLAKIYDNEKKKEKKREDGQLLAAYQYAILKYDSLGNVTEKRLDLDGKFINSASVSLDEANNLLISGLYSFKLNMNAGVFITKLNPKGEIIYAKQKEFSSIEDVELLKDVQKKDGITDNCYFDYVIPRPDGSSLIVGEFRSLHIMSNYNSLTNSSLGNPTNSSLSTGTSSMNNMNNMNRYKPTYVYYFKHLITMLVDKNGEITDLNLIPKLSLTTNMKDYTSYSVLDSDKGVYVFFNDDIDNFKSEGKRTKLISSYNDGLVAYAKISEPNAKKQIATKDTEDKLLIEPIISCKVDNKSMMFFAKKRVLLAKPSVKFFQIMVD
jgi:hypothetical protein